MAINWGASSYTLGTYSSGTPFPTNAINSAVSGSSFWITIISFGPLVYTFTDNKGNAPGNFTQINTTSNNTSDGITVASYLLTNGAGGAGHVFSVTPAGGSVQVEIYVVEITGGDLTAALVEAATGPVFGFLGNPSSNPVTSLTAGDLIASVFQNNTAALTTLTPAAGFSTIIASLPDGNGVFGQVVGAPALYDPNVSFAPSGGRTQMVTVAFKAASGGGGNGAPVAWLRA